MARLAGVSEQTVSRTVHDSPSVRPETKRARACRHARAGVSPQFCRSIAAPR
ncbi:MAG: LacI family DNA-binding transcriptional regulator [Collinsella sp.]